MEATQITEVFPWNENFATGIAKIDEQHRRLVELVNSLASHLAYQADIPTLNAIFSELTQYAAYHFQTEEEIWHQYFPEDELELAHKHSHTSFVDDIVRLKNEESIKPIETVIEDILSMLTHWLAFHILESDKRMAKAVLAVQAGATPEEAKSLAEREMSGAIKVLIETVLAMYDSLSSRTLQLLKEMMERQRAEARLRLASNVFENTMDAICMTDANGTIIDANPAFCQAADCDRETLLRKSLNALKFDADGASLPIAIWQTVNARGHWNGEVRSRSKTGELVAEWMALSCIKNDQGQISNYVGIFSNISQLIQHQHALERMASHDALTGLPNRLLLEDRLELAMAQAERNRASLAVCYLDLDGFKPINDAHGHAAGDIVLKTIADRIRLVLRANDTVARLGGDEFVLLLTLQNTAADLAPLLERLLADIAQPIIIGQHRISVTASIGISQFPSDGSRPETLMALADQAMYQAKHAGKSRYAYCHQQDVATAGENP